MQITKEGAQSLQMKMKTLSELYLKKATNSYVRLSPACSKISRTSIKVGKTSKTAPTCSTPNTGGSFQLITCRVSNATKQAIFTTLHVSVV